MIRQAISCDICGAEKRQTNHWFVAYTQAGELRITGWKADHRLRPNSKHLCGQTCLHKLLDEFITRTLEARTLETRTFETKTVETKAAETGTPERHAFLVAAEPSKPALSSEVSQTCEAASTVPEFPAKPCPELVPPLRPFPPGPVALITIPPPATVEHSHPLDVAPLMNEAPCYTSRHWRAEAWERERQRELRAVERRPDLSDRRRNTL